MATKLKVEYIPNGAENSFLKLEVYYSSGGMSMFDYKTYPRGYYASIVPVEREVTSDCVMESYTAFSGKKIFLVEAKRKGGSKIEAEALRLFAEKRAELLTAFGANNEN